LGAELLSPLSISAHVRPGDGEEPHWTKANTEITDNLPSEIRNVTDGNDCYCIDSEYDDTHKTEYRRIIITAQGDIFKPLFAAILARRKTEDPIQYVSQIIAEISHFERNGMYSFKILKTAITLDEATIDQRKRLMDAFTVNPTHMVVRDFYHKHIFTHTDLGITPVCAQSKEEALLKIWENHYGRNIGIIKKRELHKQVTELFEMSIIDYLKFFTLRCYGRLISTQQTRENFLYDDPYRAAFAEIDRNIGECLYGLSFCNMAWPSTEASDLSKKYVEATDQVKNAFVHLREKLSTGLGIYAGEIALLSIACAVLLGIIALVVQVCGLSQ